MIDHLGEPHGHHETVLEERTVNVGANNYRVAVIRADHEHIWRLERNGVVLSEHHGAHPVGWPGRDFPVEVQNAITDVALCLSWS